MSPQVRSHSGQFRRSPSRCQKVWQGILILATLALAVAANAQNACERVFTNQKPAALAMGSTIKIHYSLPKSGGVASTEKITLSKPADIDLLARRLEFLEKNLTPIESAPASVQQPGRVKRVLRFAGRHYVITLILVSAAYGVSSQLWDLYSSHVAYVNAPKYKVVYPPDEGSGGASLAPAHDDPSEAVGN